jgi:hypothetical protein
MNPPGRTSRDDGSVVLALLLSLLVVTMLTALVSYTVQGYGATGRDRHWSLAIHTAEVGVQHALYRLNQPGTVDATAMAGPNAGTTASGTYSWTAVPTTTDGRSWRVTSRGTHRDRSRTVVVEIAASQRFPAALAVDRTVRLTGNNVLDTYDSATGSPPALSPNTALIGSNGTVHTPATSTTAGGVVLHDFGAAPDPGRCTGSTALCGAPMTRHAPYDIASENAVARITSTIAWCKDRIASTTLPDWTASVHGGTGTTAVFAPAGAGPYCYRRMVFDRSTVLDARFTSQAPAEVFLEEELTVTQKVRVNAPTSVTAPRSPALRISTASSNEITWGAQAVMAASLQAPRAECAEKSGGGVELFGALVCGSFQGRGGLRLHYDRALHSQGGASFSVVSWEER